MIEEGARGIGLDFSGKPHRKTLAGVIVLGVILLGSWIVLYHNEGQSQTPIILGPEDNGKTLQVKEGTEVVVKLPENPSTGYEWRMVEGGDSLDLSENRYIPPENQTIGEGGFRRIKFTITRKGKLTLHYVRPWENQVEKTFTIEFKL